MNAWDLDEDDADEIPDAFTSAGECWAWKRRPSVIGGPTHTHVCRLPTDHDPKHLCSTCGDEF